MIMNDDIYIFFKLTWALTPSLEYKLCGLSVMHGTCNSTRNIGNTKQIIKIVNPVLNSIHDDVFIDSRKKASVYSDLRTKNNNER